MNDFNDVLQIHFQLNDMHVRLEYNKDKFNNKSELHLINYEIKNSIECILNNYKKYTKFDLQAAKFFLGIIHNKEDKHILELLTMAELVVMRVLGEHKKLFVNKPNISIAMQLLVEDMYKYHKIHDKINNSNYTNMKLSWLLSFSGLSATYSELDQFLLDFTKMPVFKDNKKKLEKIYGKDVFNKPDYLIYRDVSLGGSNGNK